MNMTAIKKNAITTFTTTALLTAAQWMNISIPAMAQVDATIKPGPELNEISQRTTLLLVGINNDQQPISSGSGSLIAKDGDRCVGVTNAHVVQSPDQELQFVVRTFDNEVHAVDEMFSFRYEDLAIITFKCQQDYELIPLATYPLTAGQEVYLSGWPANATPDGSIVRQFTSGSISTVLERPIQGYQVGYTNVTNNGMSGGQVLDSAGRLVAIHGLGARENVSSIATRLNVSEDMAAELSDNTGFNYGIPVTTFLAGVSQSGMNYDFTVVYTSPQAPEDGEPVMAQPDYVQQPDASDRVNFTTVMDNVDRVLDSLGTGAVIFCGLFRC